MSDNSKKATFGIEVTGKNGTVPHKSGYNVNPDTARMVYFNLQSGIKHIDTIVITDNSKKTVATIKPEGFKKDAGIWKVEGVDGLTTINRQAPAEKSGKIDPRLDFTSAVKTVLVKLDESFKASRAFGGQLSQENIDKIHEMRALGLTDAQIAHFLDKELKTVESVK